jgi:hypothetical protein
MTVLSIRTYANQAALTRIHSAEVQQTLVPEMHGFVTDVVFRMCLAYVACAVETAPSYQALLPHMDYLLFQIVFPTLCLTKEEISTFEDDPAEFVRKCHDPVEDFYDPRTAARDLLRALARYRQKDVLPRFLPFVQQVLSDYNNQTNPAARDYWRKEGVLVAIGTVLKVVTIVLAW